MSMNHDAKSEHYKLKIENCKMLIEESNLAVRSGKRIIRDFHFSIFTFQFAISPFSGFALQAFLVLALVTLASAQKKSSCIECHIKLDDPRLSAPAKLFDNDIHKSRGLSCNDCHGGDPNADTKEGAKDPRNGCLGKPKTPVIPAYCG